MAALGRWAGPAALMPAVIILAASAYGAEYHLDAGHSTADDSNPGTVERPWKTLKKANSALQPGDKVFIHRGRYEESIHPANSGTRTAPITYEAWADDEVFLDANPSHQACIDLSDRSHIVIRRIKVDKPGANYPAYLRMVGSQHCTVEDCDFAGSGVYHGVLVGLQDATRPSSHNILRSVRLTGCTGDIVLLRGDAHHNLFENCYFSDVGSTEAHANLFIQGLQPRGESPRFNAFVNCEFAAVNHHCVNLNGGAHHNLFHKCIFRNAAEKANAMQLAASDNIVRRCLFVNNRGHVQSDDNTLSIYTARDSTLKPGGYYTYSTAVGNRIYHNTFTGNSGYAITSFYWPFGGDYPYAIGQNVFMNNILVFNGVKRSGGEIFYDEAAAEIAADLWLNNLIGSNPKVPVAAWESTHLRLGECAAVFRIMSFQDNVQGDPQFRNAEALDYSLLPGSPCIDAGGPLTRTTSTGTGTSIPVEDSSFFIDGRGIMEGDTVVVGTNPPVQIMSIPDGTHLAVSKTVSWKRSAPISLPYSGKAPDIGAIEHQQ